MSIFRRNIPHYFNGFYWSIANPVEYLKVFKVCSDDQNVNWFPNASCLTTKLPEDHQKLCDEVTSKTQPSVQCSNQNTFSLKW